MDKGTPSSVTIKTGITFGTVEVKAEDGIGPKSNDTYQGRTVSSHGFEIPTTHRAEMSGYEWAQNYNNLGNNNLPPIHPGGGVWGQQQHGNPPQQHNVPVVWGPGPYYFPKRIPLRHFSLADFTAGATTKKQYHEEFDLFLALNSKDGNLAVVRVVSSNLVTKHLIKGPLQTMSVKMFPNSPALDITVGNYVNELCFFKMKDAQEAHRQITCGFM